MTTDSDHGSVWVPSTEAFGTRLAMVRQHEGWNAKEAAIACGLPQQSWRDWELRGARPRDLLAVCRAITDRTGVDLYWLLTGQVSVGGGGHNPGQGATYSALPHREKVPATCSSSRVAQSSAPAAPVPVAA